MRAQFIAALLTLALLAGPAWAEESFTERAERLEALRGKIETIRAELREHSGREDELTAALRDIDTRIGRQEAALSDLRERIRAAEAEVAAARERYRAAADRLERHRRFLADQVRVAYTTGREEYLRLLLNQEDPNRLDRILVYYDYLSEARAARIRTALTALEELRSLRATLDERVARLRRLEREQAETVAALAADRDERAAVLARVRERIEASGDELARLKENEQRLARLVDSLERQLADIPEDAADPRPFQASRGTLGWPVDGSVLARFGTRRSAGMQWSGLLIGAESGAPVRAVSHGRVVFSDWLRGVGLLIIIDHGDGYMTLYGHNQSLYREVGDWVRAGEVIATVGATGGQARSGLYFEVRAGGEPVNPLTWLDGGARRG